MEVHFCCNIIFLKINEVQHTLIFVCSVRIKIFRLTEFFYTFCMSENLIFTSLKLVVNEIVQ